MIEKYLAFETICSLILPPILNSEANGKLQAQVFYVGRNSCLRAMYKLTSPQATNSRFAFLAKPR